MEEEKIEMRIIPKKTVSTDMLGESIRIGSKALVEVSEPGVELKFCTESVEVLIGIGNDHTARLVMSIDAYNALKSGEEVHIETLQEHIRKLKYVNKRKK